MERPKPSHALVLPIILHPGGFASPSSSSPCVALTDTHLGHGKCHSKKRF